MYDSWSTKQRTNSSISRDITLDTVQERRVLRLNLDRWMEGGQVEKGREREREFLLEPHNWTHISTLFISSLRNDGRGLRRSRGTKARHEGDAKRAKEREAKVVGVGSGEFPRRTLIACPTFSSREEEDHSKNSSNERLLEKLNLSKSLWSFRLRFYINSLPLNKSNKNSYSSSLCSLPLWITETTAVRRAGRANVSGPGRFKPRETSSKFSFPLLSLPLQRRLSCSWLGVEWMFRLVYRIEATS